MLVFVETEDEARIAQEAGADIIGNEEVMNRIQKENFLDFDATLRIPSIMPKVGRLGRILGTRGLMPNPKAGTVVQPADLATAVQELKAGRVEFRNDKFGNLHIPVGKASFDWTRFAQRERRAGCGQPRQALRGEGYLYPPRRSHFDHEPRRAPRPDRRRERVRFPNRTGADRDDLPPFLIWSGTPLI